MFQNWNEIAISPLQTFWDGFSVFILNFIIAIIVFVVGWFVAILAGKIIAEILKKLKLNKLIGSGKWNESLVKANIKVDASEFIGAIVKWVLIIVALQVAVGIMGWSQFAGLLGSVVAYLPNVIIAVLIFAVTVIIVDIVEKLVRVSMERTKIGHGDMVSIIVKWAIWIFAIIVILEQLNIGGSIPTIVIQGVVGFLALAGGLAFGLGGKEAAADMIKELRHKLSHK